jgi:lipopolysaccharide transport system ATP-binding protein
MSFAIRAEGLGKKFVLGPKARYRTLQETLIDITQPRGRRPRAEKPEVWALKDVTFEVNEGEVVGVIGRNGAGKSTLLKVLSRITAPTTGQVELRGRIGSLLEVGTGFHPELSGRENIFLNGAILGMSRKEIRRKFDDIVQFADVEKFLDTPVKRYSSGMYTRLAFAVAAHLETEILVVDEVLAVGDAEFQARCLGKMKEVSRTGRTVLFVSHNMNAVEQLCEKVLLLEAGQVKRFNERVRDAIRDYLIGDDNSGRSSEWSRTGEQYDNPWFRPLRIDICDSGGSAAQMPISNNDEIWIRIEGEVTELDPALNVGYAIYSEDGVLLYWTYHTDTDQAQWPEIRLGRQVLESKIPRRLLNEGTYRLELIAGLHYRSWIFQPGVSAPSILLTIKGGLSDSPFWMVKRDGVLAPVIEWTSKSVEARTA